MLVTDVFGFGVLTSFWDQKLKVKVAVGHNLKNGVNAISS